MKFIIENYDGLKGYLGLDRLECMELNGKRYLIETKIGLKAYREVSVAYKVTKDTGGEEVEARKVISKRTLEALSRKLREESKKFEDD